VPPLCPDDVVARTRLDRLYAAATGQVVRVLAPPGYGKSNLVARWVGDEPRRLGWVDLERVDNDPFVLVSALVRALTFPIEEPGEPPEDIDRGGLVADAVTRVQTLVDGMDDPFVLVLDDVHHVDSAESLAVLDALVRCLPASSTLVLVGRAHHDQRSLARHRLQPGVVDVTTEQLAFDTTETDRLLRSMGVTLELDALDQLCDRFEGWVAGIRLAGLALRSEGAPAWLSPGHVGDAAFIVDYLSTEWTGQLPEDDARFLREAACLGRFTAEMCDQILGRTGSLAQLRRMNRDELLVLPLDQRDEWFRMHPLLTSWLSSDLEHTDVGRWRTIHRDAATWWAEHGDIDLAFEHAICIGDLRRAEDLVTKHGFTYIARGLQPTVRRWLDSFPNEFVTTSAELCVINALEAINRGAGTRALHWYEHVVRVLTAGADVAGDRLRERAAVLRLTLAREPAGELLPVAKDVGSQLGGDVWASLALYASGGVRFLAGDETANEALESAAFVAEILQLSVHQANCTAARGILADLAGDRDTAELAAKTAGSLLSGRRDELPPTTAMADALAALVTARAGKREAAGRHLAQGRAKLAALSSVAPWFNALCGLALTRAAVLIDDRQASRSLLRDLEHSLRLEGPGHGAQAHLEALRTSIEAARSLPSDPAWALTDAELRVLQHLPTNLTLADIATRLFVSRNTVKSHVAAIYRKLDATSRNDAVDRARRTGLLEDTSAEARD
jgi:LuxR family maltose regulon positive regulatory protein